MICNSMFRLRRFVGTFVQIQAIKVAVCVCTASNNVLRGGFLRTAQTLYMENKIRAGVSQINVVFDNLVFRTGVSHNQRSTILASWQGQPSYSTFA
eukprot:2130419-Pleurochrysis_carterae.AAC.3